MFHGAVEPVPDFYRRLEALTARFQSDLEQAGLFAASQAWVDEAERLQLEQETAKAKGAEHWSEAMKSRRERRNALLQHARREHLDGMRNVLSRLQVLAQKHLDRAPQSAADGAFLRQLGQQMKRLSCNRSGTLHSRQSMALITDVATEYQKRQILQVGVGRPYAIYVAMPFDGHTYVCRGGVYSYCERTTSIHNRLDDREWKELQFSPSGDALPWLVTRPGLGIARTLTLPELQRLSSIPPVNHQPRVHGFPPRWRSSKNPVAQLLGAVAPRELRPRIIEIASAEKLHLAVRIFLLRQLTPHRSDPLVQAFFAAELEKIVPARGNELDQVRLWYAIESRCAPQRAAAVLKQAAAQLPADARTRFEELLGRPAER